MWCLRWSGMKGLIATRDDEGVVYKILDVEFTKIKYENIVMRWFLTPFITDLETMQVIMAIKTIFSSFQVTAIKP